MCHLYKTLFCVSNSVVKSAAVLEVAPAIGEGAYSEL